MEYSVLYHLYIFYEEKSGGRGSWAIFWEEERRLRGVNSRGRFWEEERRLRPEGREQQREILKKGRGDKVSRRRRESGTFL